MSQYVNTTLINARAVELKLTPDAIADAKGFGAQTIRNVFRGMLPSRKVQVAVSEALGCPLEEAFPPSRRVVDTGAPDEAA